MVGDEQDLLRLMYAGEGLLVELCWTVACLGMVFLLFWVVFVGHGSLDCGTMVEGGVVFCMFDMLV